MNRLFIHILFLFLAVTPTLACTSAVVSARASADGRPMLWKHRDTGTEHNFIEKIPATEGAHSFIALFNGGDRSLSEAWAGYNDAGFGIMNTASYNLMPDTATIKDREALVMSAALRSCTTLADFERLLDTLPRPMGVQANFGVIDAAGGAAYFEVDDYKYLRFDADSTDTGVLFRTNHSLSGTHPGGMGYIRYDNAVSILAPEVAASTLTPQSFTEKASRSFYHSIFDKDFLSDTTLRWAVDQDFIPRNSSAASIVIVGVNPDMAATDGVMWCALGYPPCAVATPATLDRVPDILRPVAIGFRSPACDEAIRHKRLAFPIEKGSGPRYVDLDYLRKISALTHAQALENYRCFYNNSKTEY
ncbi:MAG: hypothetical protein K2M79_06695 [Muribaculaceae bacterium]|nr:hypothetical protein [Muribaculaceae bacterium]